MHVTRHFPVATIVYLGAVDRQRFELIAVGRHGVDGEHGAGQHLVALVDRGEVLIAHLDCAVLDLPCDFVSDNLGESRHDIDITDDEPAAAVLEVVAVDRQRCQLIAFIGRSSNREFRPLGHRRTGHHG